MTIPNKVNREFPACLQFQWTNTTGVAIAAATLIAVNGVVAWVPDAIAIAGTGTIIQGIQVHYSAVTAEAWEQDDVIFWDAAAGKLTSVALGNVKAGYCIEAKTTSMTSGKINLYLPESGKFRHEINASAANVTLTEAMSGATLTNLGAAAERIFSLPAQPKIGTYFRAKVCVAQDLSIDPAADDGFLVNGAAAANGKKISANAIGEWCDIEYIGGNKWSTAVIGTWTVEG